MLLSVLCSNEDEGEGYVLEGEDIGLRLTAMEYWKCSEAGMKLPFTDKKEPDCKFVVAESLPGQGNRSSSATCEWHVMGLKCVMWLQLFMCVLRKQPDKHLLATTWWPRHPAHRPVHKQHSFYCTYDVRSRCAILLPAPHLLHRGLYKTSRRWRWCFRHGSDPAI